MIVRLDGVSCVICMESLFCKRDDLDELCQIATPDCGHVFHEDCIREWFRTQTVQHHAHAREARGRSISPSSEVSDGPAECPTCRTECYADDYTGQPIIHRLFINFEGTGSTDGSSQMGSSPVRTPWKKGKAKEDEAVMGLARRAKALSEDAKRFEEDVERTSGSQVKGLVDRAEGLEKELVSQKAIDGIKKYVGGLTAAMNNLRTTIATHPLMADLRTDLNLAQTEKDEATAKHAETQRQLKHVVDVLLPQEVAAAIKAEQRRCGKEVKKVREEMEVVKRELDKEAVLRRTARREMEERLKAEETKTAEALLLAKREKAERESINATLNERMKSLKQFQAKAESRKVSKTEMEGLKSENARLREQLEQSTSASRARRPSPIIESYDPLDSIFEDSSPQPIKRKSNPRQSIFDDSLDIELPSFAMSTSNSGGRSARAHPTARTLASDLFASNSPKSKKRPPPQQSKYFASESKAKPNFLDDSDEDQVEATEEDESVAEPSPAKRSRTNPFSSTKADTERRKALAPGKPAVVRAVPKKYVETIEVSSSPESRPPLRTSKPNGSGAASGLRAGAGPSKGGVLGKQQSMVEFLGIADKNGRPLKGLAVGPKVRRKA